MQRGRLECSPSRRRTCLRSREGSRGGADHAAAWADGAIVLLVARGWNQLFGAELLTPGRATMGVVLNDGSVDQLKCLERAAECHRKATTAISPAARSRFQDAASQWL